MRIALINSNRKTTFYPVALLKLGAWQKSLGNECVLFDNKLPGPGLFDEIWITTVFTFDIYYVKAMIEKAKPLCNRVVVGGVSASLKPDFFKRLGVDVFIGLHPEAETFSPDYSLLKEKPEYVITHTSRGCVRKCGFCMVPKLEPKFFKRDWEKDLIPGVTKVFFYDNNWLAKKKSELHKDIERLRELVKAKKITFIDFNQSLDARLLTEDIAARLKGLPIKPVRFAFDSMDADGHYQTAIRRMHANGHKVFRALMLYNFEDTLEDFYYRLKSSAYLSEELGTTVGSYPMRFQPILDVDGSREYVGKYWTKQERKSFVLILGAQSISGQITQHTTADFEYWFGKDDKEFRKLLNYPKLTTLLKRKRSYMRTSRTKKQIAAAAEK